jgi:hypothetical protein
MREHKTQLTGAPQDTPVAAVAAQQRGLYHTAVPAPRSAVTTEQQQQQQQQQ